MSEQDDNATLATLDIDWGSKPTPPAQRSAQTERYEDLGLLGRGAMGEVRRVRDRQLDRTLAMKTLHRPLLEHPRMLARFLEEAKSSARLQHPNLVPIYDMGLHPDGRPWFTMREVRGRTLDAVLQEVHSATGDDWESTSSGWSLRRLIMAFETVCRAVSYGHTQRLIHRDLKPDNIMVGGSGEIYVLDWGLAKHLAPAGAAPATEGAAVAGTPAFMSPLQASGKAEHLSPLSDVYALGAILYTLLAGHAPYRGATPSQVLAQVLAGPPPPVQSLPGPHRPAELVAACQKAMARTPEARFQSAWALADVLQTWLDGAQKRQQAKELTAAAIAGVSEAQQALKSAGELKKQGEAALAQIPTWRPDADKHAAWSLLAQAEDAARQARLLELEVDQGLYAALRVSPHLPEAHAALAERHLTRHVLAEAERDPEAMAVAELQLNAHLSELPTAHPVRQSCRAYLKGDGTLTLLTEPPGAQVLLYRYTEQHRRLVEVFEGDLGTTPIRDRPLEMGSYLLVLKHPDCQEVRYPVEVPRQGHWTGIRPGDTAPHPIWLPPKGHFSEREVYIPAGWFRSGGDTQTFRSDPARRLWADAMVIQRFPVTNAEYIVFLDDLVAQGREEEALLHAPRERSSSADTLGALLFGRTPSGGFKVQMDADGDMWELEWPTFHIDWHGAEAYMAWLAARSGTPWRLPGELEWEKTARGVDGRFHPWGDHMDASFCCMADSHPGRHIAQTVHTFPLDLSPYGVRGLGGNVRDWCADLAGEVHDGIVQVPSQVYGPEDVMRTVRGGSWVDPARNARSANRDRNRTGFRVPMNGFRGLYRPNTGLS